MNRPLTLGYSTCPNDTFIFYALAHHKINLNGITYDIRLADVEALNQLAASGALDITKLSFAAIGHLLDSYALLPSGAALGRGCGPLIVAKEGVRLSQLVDLPVVVPGAWTTACLLLNLFCPHPVRTVAMSFDKIMPAVRDGLFDVGVIIHEGRFTYAQYGLTCLLDLGQWWESQTGLPIPLGGIAIRRELPLATVFKVQDSLKASIEFARAAPRAAADYITCHAQEMAPEVIAQHIALYVNEFTYDLGDEGRKAIETLFEKAAAKGFLPRSTAPLFAC